MPSGAAVILMMPALVVALFVMVRVIGLWGEKKVSVEAEVISKRSQVAYQGQYRQTPYTTYYALFQTADGRQLDLYVEGVDYAALREGTRGTLTYRGALFDRFLPIP